MDRKQQVLSKLKPKVKAFGFSKKELMSVAARVADNLSGFSKPITAEVSGLR
jgi:hypothetical protein